MRGTTSTTVPAAPTGLTFATTRTTLSASWTAPVDTGGVPIEAYGFAILIDGQFDNGLTDSLSSHLFEDLQAGTYYEVRISARNSIGFGASVVGAVTLPTAVPETPAVPTLSPSATALSVSWSAPFDSGLEITGYSVRYRTGTDAWTTEDVGRSLAYSIAGLEKN
ncbi:MAG: fibronectin type III domain-containing protein, partial [Gemmatimonadota bacterium]|nr:fibronectin type III domain-containing protein [Gemmatimonadota bacterium]